MQVNWIGPGVATIRRKPLKVTPSAAAQGAAPTPPAVTRDHVRFGSNRTCGPALPADFREKVDQAVSHGKERSVLIKQAVKGLEQVDDESELLAMNYLSRQFAKLGPTNRFRLVSDAQCAVLKTLDTYVAKHTKSQGGPHRCGDLGAHLVRHVMASKSRAVSQDSKLRAWDLVKKCAPLPTEERLSQMEAQAPVWQALMEHLVDFDEVIQWEVLKRFIRSSLSVEAIRQRSGSTNPQERLEHAVSVFRPADGSAANGLVSGLQSALPRCSTLVVLEAKALKQMIQLLLKPESDPTAPRLSQEQRMAAWNIAVDALAALGGSARNKWSNRIETFIRGMTANLVQNTTGGRNNSSRIHNHFIERLRGSNMQARRHARDVDVGAIVKLINENQTEIPEEIMNKLAEIFAHLSKHSLRAGNIQQIR